MPQVGGARFQRRDAPRCGRSPKGATTLTRPQHGKVIAGVCAGLADRFGMSPFVVRLLFLLSCLLPGPQFVIYLALWLIMPGE